jgi:pimeloyl-ACP methyl ester carboxylesterase
MTEETYNDAFGKLRRECLQRNWVYVCAYYGGNTWMSDLAEHGVADLLAILQQRWPKLPLYLCGGSMGGTSALIFAIRRPELLDAVLALCPAGDIESYYAFVSESSDEVLQSIAAAIRLHYTCAGRDLTEELQARSAATHAERLTMPVYLSHAEQDAVIPVEGVRRLAARLEFLRHQVRYVELPEGGHDAPLLEMDWPSALDFISRQGHAGSERGARRTRRDTRA